MSKAAERSEGGASARVAVRLTMADSTPSDMHIRSKEAMP
jgi:hypothetical protein